MLYEYLQQIERLLGFDLRQENFRLSDLTTFVNMARRQVAAQGQCCRWLTPSGGPIETIEVLATGSGYTDPIIHITAPDVPGGQFPFPRGTQAIASPLVDGGNILSVSVLNGGDGYFAPQVSVIDPTGTGAIFNATTAPVANRARVNQEIYLFEDIDLGANPGAKSILAVLNISLVWTNFRALVQPMGFNKYMREYRPYIVTAQTGPPGVWAQYGQGTNGSIYLYPPPDQEYGMQWDCLVLPDDLRDDESYELIPDPWRDAVPIYAAYLAMLGKSFERPSLTPLVDKFYNTRDGGLFSDMMRRARAFSQPSLARTISL